MSQSTTQTNPSEFAALLAGFTTEYEPQSHIEVELVRQLTATTWRLRYLDRSEIARMESSTPENERLDPAARFEAEQAFLDKIYRARRQSERIFQRLYKDLEARKAARLAAAALALEAAEAEIQTAPTNVQNKPSAPAPAQKPSSPGSTASPSIVKFACVEKSDRPSQLIPV